MIKTDPAIRILGIDPGTRFTGVGIIDRIGNKLKIVHSETINAAKEELLEQKLAIIFLRITDIIKEFAPIEGAVERVFHSVNPRSSLLLGHARGVSILAMNLQHLKINDYAPNEVKSAITGAGKASKEQVGAMVQILLNLDRNIKLKRMNRTLWQLPFAMPIPRTLLNGKLVERIFSMIAWLRGRILHIEKNEVTVNTGNIGYSVFMGENRLLQMGVQMDQEIELVVYTLVREDEIRLFGFDSFLSRSVFMILLSVNGIGPKAASNIVDKLEPNTIIAAIIKGDHFPFLAVPGIGKKTAQRIILDLQGKLDSFVTEQTDSENENPSQANQPEQVTSLKLIKDAKSALLNLGFTDREADRVVRQYLKPGIGLDEIIRKSLADLRQ